MTPQHDVLDQSATTLTTDITLMVLSSIFIITRLYVRKFVSNNLGLDDCAALISLVRALKNTNLVMGADYKRPFSQRPLVWNSRVRLGIFHFRDHR